MALHGFLDIGFIYVIILSLVEIFGDFNLRFYAQTGKLTNLYLGVVGYMGVIFFLIQSLRYGNVLYVNGLWDGMSNIVESLAAYYYLGDRLENTAQYIGLFSVVAGIGLMRMK